MDDLKNQVLRNYGLSNNEAKVYLANLMIGQARVNEIARKSNILRTTTYEVLKSLAEKGFASYVIKSGVKYFEAADPDRLMSILDEKKQQLKGIMPDLQAIKESVTEKPRIEIFEGKQGLKTILDDVFKINPREIYAISSPEIYEILMYYFPNWINRRIKAGIHSRILQKKAKIIDKIKKKYESPITEIRFLPHDFRITTHMQIYGNRVIILTLRKEQLIGIQIENQDVADAQLSMFNALWKLCKG